MNVRQRGTRLIAPRGLPGLLSHIGQHSKTPCANTRPIRFAVVASENGLSCEYSLLTTHATCPEASAWRQGIPSLFEVYPRIYEDQSTFNVAMIVPTGIGAEIGGHAGDACPAAKLLAATCDTLITHPNVVNASDINEMPENALYVEGSMLTDLMLGQCGLMPVRSNRVMLLVAQHDDSRIRDIAVNAYSAARATIGLEGPGAMEIEGGLKMRAHHTPGAGTAAGDIDGLEHVMRAMYKYRGLYDAVAIASVIDVDDSFHKDYFLPDSEMVNPWGGVEAMLTHAISTLTNVPVAHAPMCDNMEIANLEVGVVDPRKAPEAVSEAFLHCVLKGLHRAPRITRNVEHSRGPGVLSVENVSALVIPDGCVGIPTLAAFEQGIPVIAVRENRNLMQNDLSKFCFRPGGLIVVENYLEAAGVLAAMRAGVSLESVRRPLAGTRINPTANDLLKGH